MKSFKGKTVLITGGSSGIGLALAIELATEGANVAITATSQKKLDIALAALTVKNARVIAIKHDVTDVAAWPIVINQVEAELGPIQGLFLNAGIGPAAGPVELNPLANWRWSLEVNLMGVVHGLMAALPGMKARKQEGAILITASIASVTCPPNNGAYVVAKAAALSLGEVLRKELNGSPLSVSVLLPAAVNTDLPSSSKRHTPTGSEAADYNFMENLLKDGMDPLMVARYTLAHIKEGKFYIFSHPEFKARLEARYSELLAGMDKPADPNWQSKEI